jgi:exodeoxyribonuclease VIII
MLIKNISNDEYRAMSAVSKSDLDLVARDPALLEWKKHAPREESESGAAEIGTATHCALLEPERFATEYRQQPAFDKRTSAGKAAAAEFEAAMAGKVVLANDDHLLVTAMRDSVLAHPHARELLTSDGVSEASILFELNGVKCKCRPDRLPSSTRINGRPVIMDLKTTDDIEKIKYAIVDYRYDVQAAFYSAGYEQQYGETPVFVFVFVGKKRIFGQHHVRVCVLSDEKLAAAREKIDVDLAAYKEFLEFGLSINSLEIIK